MQVYLQLFQLMSTPAVPTPAPLFLPPVDGDSSNHPENSSTSPNNTVLYIQPSPVGIESKQETKTDWNSSLCGCCADSNACCKTALCPCITSSEIAEIITEGKTLSGDAMVMLGVCCIAGFCTCCMVNCMGMYTCRIRRLIRSKFKIKGSPCKDCLTHAFCMPCALCQEYRELDHQGFDPSLGWFENVERQRYAVAIYTITPPKTETMERT